MYKLLYSKHAAKFIKKQDRPLKTRIENTLLTLAEAPFATTTLDIKYLKGTNGVFRLRIGKIRILYEVIEEELVIYIITAGNRGDVYK
ncbi:type II toxin-antitoxin system RelE family toxin [Alteribacter natronophilus]|uniref:type II toxin-antitoxin system RelE family toxin n=1 Tax=Alteribacter natronophilus TaxID=2583810 RepID=UPI00110DDAB2|nr:type II toxin-antitoxin system RelE/ParE family toxin [Alteribacter natronophilus]TMW70985.1 type II toxin-antitoxin system RelE/ParE family toxin [Alteribacter natronophilus]